MRWRLPAAVLPLLLTVPYLLPAQAQVPSVGLTEERAIALALAGSEAVRLRDLAQQKARIAVDEARAIALPRVDLQLSGSYLVNPPTGYTVKAGELGSFTPTIPPNTFGPGSPAVPLGDFSIPATDFSIGSQQHDYFSLTASLAQPLFTWGRISGGITLAALAADAAGTDLVAQRRDIRREVSRAYDGALLAAGSAAVLARLHDTAQGIVEDRQKAVDDGTTNREALLQAKADLAQVDARRIDAEQAYQTSLLSLSLLTGLDPAAISLDSGFNDSPPTIDEQALVTAALAVSPDLAAARIKLSQARAKLGVEKGGSLLLPDVSLGMQLNVTGQEDLPWKDWSGDASGWSWDLVVSLGVRMSVFDGLASFSRIAQADKDVSAAATFASQEEKLVRLAVRRAVDTLQGAGAGVQEKRAAWEYAAERLRNAQASYDNGLVSRADLRGAQLMEGTAALALLSARAARDDAAADLTRLAGDTP
jgi:outer membrane protein